MRFIGNVRNLHQIMIINNKVALIADIHIGVNKNSEEFYELTKQWIEYFISEITQNQIKDVFVLGDWHHYRDEISVQTLDISSEIMNMFPKDINIHILTGNHDCYFKDNSKVHSLQMFKGWNNVFIYDDITQLKSKSNKTISIIPWGYDIKDTLDSDYVFGHFEIQNFKMNNFTICNDGVESKNLLDKCKNIYTGHFHKQQSKQYKKGSITYIGSPLQYNFNDVDNENGYYILDLENNTDEFIVNTEVPTFKYVKLSNIKKINYDDLTNNWVKLFIDKTIKESELDKEITKIRSFKPRNLIINDVYVNKNIDINKNVDKITSINIEDSIIEYIESLGDTIKFKDETLKKINDYYIKHKQTF